MAKIDDLVAKLDTRAPLDRSPKKNWVENKGGLPMYVRRIANHLHAEKGMDIGHAIAVAVNVVKKMCASGDINFPGKQTVNAGSRAEACAAASHWESMKKSGEVSKVRIAKGLKVELSDVEYMQVLHHMGAVDYHVSDEVEKSDEFELRGEVSKADEDKQLVFGWGQVAKRKDGSVVYDRQGDFIEDISHLENAAYTFVTESRTGGEMHVRKGVSTMVESFVSTPEKLEAMGLAPDALPQGWWVGFKVSDPEVWDGIKKGKYPMFSVHGRGIRKVVEVDE